ncbi:hemolysin [Variovorax sp. Sphag1AA]|uniref:hemolysin n=1 Tax=Variovorax sp. Sphag1AA TaxID=2587027 RepID=UPI0016197B34|nr:hemolysin [Variovorax sp. Sphag1AA]MBB3175711.1 hypothetical protein [Variovorax sp. Sphag1AA]
MAELNQRDLDVLQHYADKGNRSLYWNYLAQRDGGDSYGLLALGVVRNSDMSGAIANTYAQHHAREHDKRKLSEREWEKFGQDLIQQDLALRKHYMAQQQPAEALNLPVKDVQTAHDQAFENVGLNPDAWTPRRLLEAARRQGGESAAEDIWRNDMLDSSVWGLSRAGRTMAKVAWQYNDGEFDAFAYTSDLAAAAASASRDLPCVDPDTIGGSNLHFTYDAQSRAWTSVTSTPDGFPTRMRVTDARTLAELDDARAVRLERAEKATQFHPLDPHREIARSPFTLVDAGQPETTATRLANIDASLSRTIADDLFTRLTNAAMNRDVVAMRTVSAEFRHSDEGRSWLRSGREHNQADQDRQAALEAQATMQQAVQSRSGPVMSM